MWEAADRAALIDPDLPGYALATLADLSTVAGLFRNPSGAVFGNIGGSRPTFFCQDAMAPHIGDTITVNAGTYRVVQASPDGNGFTLLDLDTP